MPGPLAEIEEVFDHTVEDLPNFGPETWLRPGCCRSDLPVPAFGQGWSICQGKRVAVDSVFMQVASPLWASKIEPIGGEMADPWRCCGEIHDDAEGSQI